MKNICFIVLGLVAVLLLGPDLQSAEISGFVKSYCIDCHRGDTSEGSFDLEALSFDLNDPAVFAAWERVFDRVEKSEMPPSDASQPSDAQRFAFSEDLAESLSRSHSEMKGTVLRRLNRREYENTLNDLFGVSLDLADDLPEDARSHEFDNVGEALGVSMTHLERYIAAAGRVVDAAIAQTTEAPEPTLIDCHFRESEVDREMGKTIKRLDDGALVRFSASGLSGGHLREGGTRVAGKYRVRVTGYAYQSEKPITVSVFGTSYKAGSEQPLLGFFSFPPGKATTVEVIAEIDKNYMLRINPYGISDPDHYKRESVDGVTTPGFAFLSATLEGPLVDEFPSRGHQLIFEQIQRAEIEPGNPNDKTKSWYRPKFAIQTENELADVRQSIARVARHAFRRPVSPDEIEPYLELFKHERDKGEDIETSLKTSIVAVLSSPSFIYLTEATGKLDDHALANRLSYFLNRTAPDDELVQLADEGQLARNSEMLRLQTERLMRDRKFDRFLTDFSDAWLNLRELDFTRPDAVLFPEYDDFLHASIRGETEAYLRELIVKNYPVSNLVQSDFAMLNSRLADHYGLPEVSGVELRKVSLPTGSVRGGLLTQASILKVSANGTNTSPVVRGAWVLERIFGEAPSPPPPGIAGVEPDIRGATTLRELLDLHRDTSSCQACHQKIDPPGFALEQFNPIGGFRERFRSIGEGEKVDLQIDGRNVRYRLGRSVDASGKLETGEQFANYLEFRDLIASDQARLSKAFTTKLLTFATGREMGFSDRDEIARIVEASSLDGYRLGDLFHLVISSQIFQEK
ncbi:MAG: DUF1592 domain-containing protein [Rubripirellula sp.]